LLHLDFVTCSFTLQCTNFCAVLWEIWNFLLASWMNFPTVYYKASWIQSAVTVDGWCTYVLLWKNAHILPLFKPTFNDFPPGTYPVYSRQWHLWCFKSQISLPSTTTQLYAVTVTFCVSEPTFVQEYHYQVLHKFSWNSLHPSPLPHLFFIFYAPSKQFLHLPCSSWFMYVMLWINFGHPVCYNYKYNYNLKLDANGKMRSWSCIPCWMLPGNRMRN